MDFSPQIGDLFLRPRHVFTNFFAREGISSSFVLVEIFLIVGDVDCDRGGVSERGSHRDGGSDGYNDGGEIIIGG